MNYLLGAAAAATALVVPAAAAASTPFAYNYGAETAEAGETELASWTTLRSGKDDGRYRALDLQLEVEHGFSDRFQGAFYLTFDSHRIRGLEPQFDDQSGTLRWNGAKAEFITQLRSPDDGKLGVALYIEPSYSRFSGTSGERETKLALEGKLLLEKRFAERWRWVGNVTLEQEFEHDGGEWEPELEAELSTGLSARLGGGFSLGGEARWTNKFADFPNRAEREGWALFAGPTVHYDGHEWFATLAYQRQLAGGPGGSLNLDEFERNEVRLKLGMEF